MSAAIRASSGSRVVRGGVLVITLFLSAALMSSCHATTFRVGMGNNGIGQQTTHQYYLLFGLVRLNEVNIQRMVPDYTSYDVEVGFSYRDGFAATLGDFFVSLLFLPLTVTRQVVTVRW
ncbi:MAG: hypothetical protein KDC87_17370 [Planctomycetes bacterium]|nr:hypothetical protein [Planctomycetota bacterium]MCB9872054.1 hypothetical protein [Planctomycetota bacterium]MCB9889777.1 hypothetical protein [Planctomycetota bacterium]